MTERLHSTQGTGVSPDEVALGEAVDHRLPETGLVVEDVVRDAERLGDPARVVDVLAGAAGALAMGRGAVVVELERDADDVVALLREERRDHGRVDAARHRDDDARVGRRLRQIEGVQHGCRAFEARASSRRGGLGSIGDPAPVAPGRAQRCGKATARRPDLTVSLATGRRASRQLRLRDRRMRLIRFSKS